jgi:hypothetical protein
MNGTPACTSGTCDYTCNAGTVRSGTECVTFTSTISCESWWKKDTDPIYHTDGDYLVYQGAVQNTQYVITYAPDNLTLTAKESLVGPGFQYNIDVSIADSLGMVITKSSKVLPKDGPMVGVHVVRLPYTYSVYCKVE